jgi:Domain of unknown function (DUF3303)
VLFGIVYKPRNWSEETAKRSLNLFGNWQPPVEFKHHWALATGSGIAVAEADSAAAVLEAVAAFAPFFEFQVEPAVPIEEAVPIFSKTNAWRESMA